MSKAELYALTYAELERWGIDCDSCRFQQKDASGPVGGILARWTANGKPCSASLPHDVSNSGELRIFKATVKKQNLAAGLSEPKEDPTQIELESLKGRIEHLEKRAKDADAAHQRLIEEVKAATDLALDKAAQMENAVGLFQGLAAMKPQPQPEPKQPEYPKITIAPVPRFEPKKEIKPNRLDALEQARAELWAKVANELDTKFRLDDFDGRILHFLYKCGPQTAHTLKTEGVWKSQTESVTRFLEDMEADGLVAFQRCDNKWAITTDGIVSLEEEAPAAVAPPPAPVLASAALPPPLPIAPTPVLKIVPKPKILEAVPVLRKPDNLSIKDECLVYLYEQEQKCDKEGKTSAELKAAGLKGYGAEDDMRILCTSLKSSGYIQQTKRGGPYLLTEIGRQYVRKILGIPQNNELRRKFAK